MRRRASVREEDHAERDPDHGDQHVDEPFRLGVFLALRDAEGHRRHREDARQLPAPERERREPAEREPRVAGALHDVVAGAHQRRAAEREDDAEGVVGADAAERQPGDVEVQRRPRHLRGGEHADRHADDAPDGRGQQEQADDVVVVGFFIGHRHRPSDPHDYRAVQTSAEMRLWSHATGVSLIWISVRPEFAINPRCGARSSVPR